MSEARPAYIARCRRGSVGSDRRISRWLVQRLKVWLVQALEDMAAKNEGMVTCPRTGEICHFTELRKVYVS